MKCLDADMHEAGKVTLRQASALAHLFDIQRTHRETARSLGFASLDLASFSQALHEIAK
jgi:hypothetical protein